MTQLDHKESLRHEAWRVFRIMSEFVDAFETLAKVAPAVSMFGSGRTRPSDPDYPRAMSCAAKRVETDFAVITGGGPGIAGHRLGRPRALAEQVTRP